MLFSHHEDAGFADFALWLYDVVLGVAMVIVVVSAIIGAILESYVSFP